MSANGTRFIDPLGLDVTPGVDDRNATGESNGVASAAMVLGVLAVATAWMPFIVVFGVVAAVLAVAFGLVGLRRSQVSGVGRNRAIVGLATGASGLVAGMLGVVLTVIVVGVYDDYLNPAPHEVTITSCTVAGSRASATGTLTNLGDSTADFSVVVDFVRRGTDNVDRQGRVDVDEVEAGDSTEFTVERQVTLDDVDCIVSDVNGPLPFGLDLD